MDKDTKRLFTRFLLVIIGSVLAIVLLLGLLVFTNVTEPPQPPVTVNAQRLEPILFTLQDSVVTNTNGSDMDVTQLSNVVVQVEGIGSATVTFQGSVDGSTWYAVEAVNRNNGSKATSTTADSIFDVAVGFAELRTPVSSWASGTIIVTAIGKDGGVAPPADVSLAANSGVDIGDVDVLSIAAGETHAMEVGTDSNVISVTLSLDTGAYASGEVLADRQQLDGAFRVSDGTGVLYSVMVIDLSGPGQALDLIFLQTDCTLGTENSAVSIADSCAQTILCAVEVAASDYVDLVNSQVAVASPSCLVEAVSGTDDLYVGAVSRGTGTYAANGIVLKIGILND